MLKTEAIALARGTIKPMFVVEEAGDFFCWEPAWGSRPGQTIVFINGGWPADPHKRLTPKQKQEMRVAKLRGQEVPDVVEET